MSLKEKLKNCGKIAAVGAVLAAGTIVSQTAEAQQTKGGKPNILVIFGDDIGYHNISAYSLGLMGFKTPNIDRIAKEGILFTDYYGQQSCTAGRAAFITGQCPFRTGLTKVGMPGAPVGLQAEDPTIAEFLKPLGYATGQFGKNHLGDQDKYLPTRHGFDEFFGNLYHLNAEEEPEQPEYPKDAAFLAKHKPRGVLRSTADGKVEDTGPLTKKRMETVDEEFLAAAKDFITRQVKSGTPFFTWFNATRMHVNTHLKPASQGKTGLGLQADGMVEHDAMVGDLLKLLDDLGIADNTIVIYTTDNGAMKNQWPDGGVSPFRSEKDTNWEGAVRVPCAARWPGHIQPGTISNDIVSAEDWLPTLVAAAGGNTNLVQDAPKGVSAGNKSFKVHLDGYNQLPYLTGKADKSPRNEFYYFDDDGNLVAARKGQYKVTFALQEATGMAIWRTKLSTLKAPFLIDLRQDPYEYAYDGSTNYEKWMFDKNFLIFDVIDMVSGYLATYENFPPRQSPASFTIDKVTENMKAAADARNAAASRSAK
ncbi:MAG: arylsulfatase [Tannerella sp.]|jgi:arylsulfatase|nr:arylsulfatase [Tannerella sp.]